MFREFRLAFRALRKQPGFTAIVILTIALGVGANSAIFTVVDAVMLRPLPFHDAGRVVVINERTPQFPLLSLSADNFRDVCREATTLQACGAFRNFTANMSGGRPPRFRVSERVDVRLPIAPFIAARPVDRGWHPGILPVARLRDGVSIDRARAEVAAIAARLEKAYPETNTNVAMTITPARDLLIQGVRPALLVLLAAVAGVLLIACINVAGLLLARGLTRRRDVAVRIALGASRARVVGHLLAESVLMSIAGGAAGLLLASFSVPVLLALVGPTLPRADMVTVDGRVVAFTFGLALLTGLVFGLIPALQSTKVDIRETLNEAGRSGIGGGRWQRRARATLVIVEIAVTVVLTVGAALLIRSFARLQNVSPGFDAAHALAADVPLSGPKYANNDVRTGVVER